MAKKRPQIVAKSERPKSPKGAPGKAASGGSSGSASSSQDQAGPQTHSGSSLAPRRSTYFEAVAVYEKGLEALQRHAYGEAISTLESVLRQFPEEKELHERVRLYLNVCQKHVAPDRPTPKTVDERLYAATLATNGGRYEEAIAHLRLVRDEDPDNDHALYMIAVALALRGEHAEAVAHLERAIAINPENRALARREADFESLRSDEAFRSALDSTGSQPRPLSDRRKPPRSKTGQ